MILRELERYIGQLLEISSFHDYCPNGVQVEGRPEVRTIVSGVSASLDVLQAASAAGADAVLVHHGYFWKNEGPQITGIKRARPETVVFTYQGDGDLAAIGTGEIVHAAGRCERITVIYVNNGVFGATGGQQAPTTLIGQPTTSYPAGRDAKETGYPLRMAEMLAVIAPEAYIARVSVHDVAHIRKTKKAIRRAFEVQIEGGGFGMVEVLAACPTNWRLDPLQAMQKIKSAMMAYYPLGEFSAPLRKETRP